jgi:hypothetical protein
VKVDQIPNSCSSIATSRDARTLSTWFRSAPDHPLVGQILPAGFHKRFGWDGSNSRSAADPGLPFCASSAKSDFTFESPAFPLPYSPNIDCLYRVYKDNERACALELTLTEFVVGTASPADQLHCPNDYLEINAIRYCGRRTGEKIRLPWSPLVSHLNMRFFTDATDQLVGFRINARQLQGQECGRSSQVPSPQSPAEISPAVMYGSLSPSAFSSHTDSYGNVGSAAGVGWNDASNSASNNGGGGWSVNAAASNRFSVESLHYFNQKSLANNQPTHCPTIEHSGQRFRIQSPSLSNVEPSRPMNCVYRVWKTKPEVCALRFTFHDFQLTSSSACRRDSLVFGLHRFCGQLPKDTVRKSPSLSYSLYLI